MPEIDEAQKLREEAAQVEAELEQLRIAQREASERMRELHDKQRAALKQAAEVEERKRQEELATRKFEIRAVDFDGFRVTVRVLPEIRDDILAVLRGTKSREYDHYTQTNRLSIEHWPEFVRAASLLSNVSITHSLGIQARIKHYFEQPEWTIELRERNLKVTPHPRAITSVVHDLPGAVFNASKGRYYDIPLSEGWRLAEVLSNYTRQGEKRKIVWDDKALKLVEEEAARRARLDTVATQSDSTLDVQFQNGHTLRPFQKVGIEFVDLAGGRALVADQMGLGKTWQGVGYAVLRGLRTVIICPAHLKANWTSEIIKLTGKVPTVLSGREPDDFAVKTLLMEKPQFTVINYDILAAKTVIPSTETVDENGVVHRSAVSHRFMWAELLNLSRPDLVIIDEAHYIKNTSSNRSVATRQLDVPHRLALTGTPVLNRPGEYWAVLNWLRPEIFPSEDKFLSQYTSDGKYARNTEQLRNLLKPIMIRRLKKDVVAELPPINRITQFHELTPEAQARYKQVLAGVYMAIDRAGNHIERNVTSILAEIGKLKEVCAHDKVPVVVEHALNLNDSAEEGEVNNKILIFSQYKDVVRKIAHGLGREAIYWTGDTAFEERTRLEHKFQNDPSIRFLVVSLMTGQTGLNLTAAGHIIFADLWWTPAAHQQAEERAYGRLSNLHGAESYYFITKATIEEWIQEMLQSKLGVIEAVVEGIDAERDPSIGMEIISRLNALRGKF